MTNGFLVLDIGDKIISSEEEYAVTTNPNNIGPITRSVFVIERVSEKDGFNDDVVHYGQEIRIRSNDLILNKKLIYLRSIAQSPLRCARFSRNQEVSMYVKPIYDTVWMIEHIDPNMRMKAVGNPLYTNEPIILKHCSTAHYLASDFVDYRNDFGSEYEVCVHSYSTANKSQQLILEKTGKLNRDQPTKFQTDQNIWFMMTSNDPNLNFVPNISKVNVDDLLFKIKKLCIDKGIYGLRGLSKIFKMLDKANSKLLSLEDFKEGLLNHGIQISSDEISALLVAIDKEKKNMFPYEVFIYILRGEPNPKRIQLITEIYENIVKPRNGKITLDEIAKMFNPEKHPDVLKKQKTPEEVYNTFMYKWDTQNPEALISKEEFIEYFLDLSACIESDEYFTEVLKSGWQF